MSLSDVSVGAYQQTNVANPWEVLSLIKSTLSEPFSFVPSQTVGYFLWRSQLHKVFFFFFLVAPARKKGLIFLFGGTKTSITSLW